MNLFQQLLRLPPSGCKDFSNVYPQSIDALLSMAENPLFRTISKPFLRVDFLDAIGHIAAIGPLDSIWRLSRSTWIYQQQHPTLNVVAIDRLTVDGRFSFAGSPNLGQLSQSTDFATHLDGWNDGTTQ